MGSLWLGDGVDAVGGVDSSSMPKSYSSAFGVRLAGAGSVDEGLLATRALA